MSLPRFAMQRRPITLTIVALAFALGVIQVMTMSRRADPLFTIRTAQVVTSWPGVEAERVERLVTAPLEEEISQLAEVDYVWSTTTTGQSVVYVELPDSLPTSMIQQTWERVRGKVDLVRPSGETFICPPGTRGLDPISGASKVLYEWWLENKDSLPDPATEDPPDVV